MRLFGAYGCASGLAIDAVESRTLELREPSLGERGVVGRARDVHGMRHAAEQVDELCATHLERLGLEVAVASGEQVEGDEHRGRGLGEHVDAGCCGVDALRQRLPVEALRTRLALGHHDLAVDEARLGKEPRERLDELGKVARQRLRAAAADLDVLAVP